MTGWMRLTGERPLQLVRIRDAAFGYADLADGFLRLIVIEGDFEKDFFHVADSLLGAGGAFLDVGANHGLLSFGLAHAHGHRVEFHLFEPNPTLIHSIHATKALYPSMRCTVNAFAVSDHTGFVPFLIADTQTGTSRIAEGAATEVRSVTLDAYLCETGVEHVALLKIDVEGHELPALHGARRSLESRRIGAIYFEYFEKYLIRVGPPSGLLDFLASLDYTVCFCRAGDLHAHGGRSHTIRGDLPGHGLELVPVTGHPLPAMTDLLAVPAENLVPYHG